jgi:hypothetical protein
MTRDCQVMIQLLKLSVLAVVPATPAPDLQLLDAIRMPVRFSQVGVKGRLRRVDPNGLRN